MEICILELGNFKEIIETLLLISMEFILYSCFFLFEEFTILQLDYLLSTCMYEVIISAISAYNLPNNLFIIDIFIVFMNMLFNIV